MEDLKMIPKERKRGAALVTLAAFGLVAAGAVIGVLWVITYAPK
jgi:hypothetical protein